MTKNYDYLKFISNIPALEQDALFATVLENALNLPKAYDKSKITNHFKSAFGNGSLSTIQDRLTACLVCIDQQLEMFGQQQEVTDKILNLKNNINDFLNLIKEVVKEQIELQNAAAKNDEETSGKATSYQSFSEKTDEIQSRLNAIDERLHTQEGKLEKHEGTLNDKLFSLIINTVAILGIFVAVAFAGFGANTLFSNISFEASGDIWTNTFYLCLTAFLAYNLLFLLFYCIFKIIEHLSSKITINLWKQCWAFIVLDVIMLALTVYLFVRVNLG